MALLLLAVGLRLLPVVAAPWVSDHLSRALGVSVEMDAVSVQPIDGVVILSGVVVRARGSDDDEPPRLSADRAWIDVQWLPLIHRTLRVREVGLEAARIEVDRLADGSYRVADLALGDPASALPADWHFALDRIALLDARLRVRDGAAAHATPIDLMIRDGEVSGLAGRPVAFRRSPNLRLEADVGHGRIRIDGRYAMRDEGVSLDALIRVTDVPLADLVAALGDPSGDDLAGSLSGSLHWQREPHRRDRLDGRLVLESAALRRDGEDEPAFAVRRAVVEVDEIDLLAREVAIASLELERPTLLARGDARAPLPVLDGLWPPARAERRSGRREPSVRRADGGAEAAAAPPWSWVVHRLTTADARLRLATGDATFDFELDVAGENLGPNAYWSPVRIELERGGARAVFDGTARGVDGGVLEGRIAAAGIDVPDFARAVGLPWAELAQAGSAVADLQLTLEWARPLVDGIDLRGRVDVTDLAIAGPAPEVFSVDVRDLALDIRAVLPREDAKGRTRPTRVDVRSATASGLHARLTRTEDGIVLSLPPPEGDPAVDGAVNVAMDGSAAPAVGGDAAALARDPARPATEDRRAPDLAAPAEAPAVELLVRALRLRDGTIRLADRSPVPAVDWELRRVVGSAEDLQLPALRFARLDLSGSAPRLGPFSVTATRGAGRDELELVGSDVDLADLSPYLAQAGLPYRFAGGRAWVLARVGFAGERWSGDALLVLRNPSFGDSAAALEDTIGMPISVALGRLRDRSGDVVLRLPLASSGPNGRPALRDVVAYGIRDAVRRASDPAEVEVAFEPGRVDLTEQGRRELERVGHLLAEKPGLVVTLAGVVSEDDRRWLEEQALRAELDGGGGFFSILRSFGRSGETERIREALAARAAGAPGRLDPADAAALERLLAERTPVASGRLADLAYARLARVREHLVGRGINPARVATEPPGLERAGPPAVRLDVRFATAAGSRTAGAERRLDDEWIAGSRRGFDRDE